MTNLHLHHDDGQYIDRRGAAKLTGLSYSYLAHRVRSPDGPPAIKIGRRVLYKVSDLRAWLDAHRATQAPRPRGRPRKQPLAYRNQAEDSR